MGSTHNFHGKMGGAVFFFFFSRSLNINKCLSTVPYFFCDLQSWRFVTYFIVYAANYVGLTVHSYNPTALCTKVTVKIAKQCIGFATIVWQNQCIVFLLLGQSQCTMWQTHCIVVCQNQCANTLHCGCITCQSYCIINIHVGPKPRGRGGTQIIFLTECAARGLKPLPISKDFFH